MIREIEWVVPPDVLLTAPTTTIVLPVVRAMVQWAVRMKVYHEFNNSRFYRKKLPADTTKRGWNKAPPQKWLFAFVLNDTMNRNWPAEAVVPPRMRPDQARKSPPSVASGKPIKHYNRSKKIKVARCTYWHQRPMRSNNRKMLVGTSSIHCRAFKIHWHFYTRNSSTQRLLSVAKKYE